MISAAQTTIPASSTRTDTATIARNAAIQGTFNVLATVLAVRFTLLVSVVGAFALAWVCVGNPDPWRAAILAGYALIVVVPLVVLAARR